VVSGGGGDGDLIHGDGAHNGCDCSVVVVVKGHTESDNGVIHRVQALGVVMCDHLRRVIEVVPCS
jgi:hypothetical protein